uniref:Macaca fascicularis brain cDNA clone: QflA-20441, similar to human calpain 7 (CAPN7), mRNA, RefSeq: NM_014296.2 n=1 Tax=Macaca fascicularis TaxID=9541 RepID=I7GIJ7_MACFA|nr:unnamed protein product [Macaca fascicularis]
MDATALERDAVQFARLAVQRDHEGRYSEAVFYYKEAAQALIYAEMAGSSLENIQEKITEYLERVQALHSAVQSKSADPLKSKHQLDLERAHFLVTQAFDEDEKENVEDAIELYTEAVDLCLLRMLPHCPGEQLCSSRVGSENPSPTPPHLAVH